MLKQLLLLIACCTGLAAHAQKNGTISGNVTDTLAGKPVESATITLLQKKDSSLVSFTMTDSKGHFELSGIGNGEYRLLITHIKYHAASRAVSISAGQPHVNVPAIALHDLSRQLSEVEVSAEAPPVTLVGDTVQYNAGSFKTPPNASVEQLLKKMPGIQVDKNGSIKAQGQKVNRVLVDGKEFFGTDPKIATKNLPADAVDKVQVYDRMSDAAQLTGFDDGNSEKTINLKLKRDKKKGLFGKAMAGGGNNGRYEGRFNINSFKGARQLSAIGMGNNTNAEGFSFMDMMNFSGELNRMRQSGGGTMSFTMNSDDPMAAMMGGNNNGINTIFGGGLNYNNMIGKKTDFTSNYFFNRYSPQQESQTERQYFLPDSSYFYHQQANSNTISNTQRLNMSADIKIDSFHSVKIISSGGYRETSGSSNSTYETLTGKGVPAIRGFNNSSSGGTGSNFSNDVLFRKKFRRSGRTFSLQLQNSYNKSNGNSYLLSGNQFLLHQQPTNDTIHQQTNTSGSLNSYNARAVYTEPLFKRSLLEASISHSSSQSTSDRTTYDYNAASGKFDQLNKPLSNNFENVYGYTNAGLRIRTKQKKYNFALGLNWQQAALEGKIISGVKDSVIRQTFYNLLPSMRFKYDFTKYRNLSINYAAITNQPTLSQLQPVPDISDPLNIKEGNPNLKQEFTHALQMNFISVNPFRNKNLFAFFNLQETQHKIVNSDVVDSLGVKRTRPVNVNGVYNMSGTVQLGLPLPIWKGNVNISANTGYTKTEQFINKAANTIRSFTLGPGLRFDLNPTEKIDMSLSAGLNYYQTSYSLQSALSTRYFSQQYEGEFNWRLPANFFFNTSFTYIINNGRTNGYNTHVPICNTSLSRQLLHSNRGELKLSVYDLFNENVGISRSSNQNYIEDTRVRNLQRYLLLSFTYSLSKSGLTQGREAGGIRMIRH
jgi:5-hydroxyisourate hydrolase-like protein (transthyretin family)